MYLAVDADEDGNHVMRALLQPFLDNLHIDVLDVLTTEVVRMAWYEVADER